MFNNFTDFQINLAQMDFEPDVLIITECRLNLLKPIPQIPNYITTHTSNNLNQNDGVVVYSKKHLNANLQEIILENASCIGTGQNSK